MLALELRVTLSLALAHWRWRISADIGVKMALAHWPWLQGCNLLAYITRCMVQDPFQTSCLLLLITLLVNSSCFFFKP